jgi:short-subunit dehydrogenase
VKQFQDKIAVVTGGAAGIGRALSEELAGYGATVIIADINAENAEQTANEIKQAGGRAIGKQLDVINAEEIEQLLEEIVNEHGRIDYMINNAGIGLMGEVRDMELEQYRRLVDVNIMGIFYGCRAAYSIMIKQGFGHIVNVGSIAGLIIFPIQSVYSATKFAIHSFTMGLRAEAAALGINVSVICPMNIKSAMLDGSMTVVGMRDKNWFANLPVKWMDANEAARKMLKGVAKNKGVIIVPGKARMFWWIFRLFPKLFDFIDKEGTKVFRKDRVDA